MSSTPLIMSVALDPKTKADQEKMGIALSKLEQEDPTFKLPRVDKNQLRGIVGNHPALNVGALKIRFGFRSE